MTCFCSKILAKLRCQKCETIIEEPDPSDQSEKDFINSLDDYLNMKLLNYSRILQKHDKDYGIIFHMNNIVSEKFKNFPEKLYLNLKYINKGYYNNPILHIIY